MASPSLLPLLLLLVFGAQLLAGAAAAAAPWGARAAASAFADLPCYEDDVGPPPRLMRSRFGSLREMSELVVAPFLALQRERLAGAAGAAVAAAWVLDGARGADRLRETIDAAPAGGERTSGRPAPFVQRLLLPVNATVAVFGDLHGSYHSFLRSLLSLAAAGFLDAETFAVAPAFASSFFMLFLGDYVDRGAYGVEVLAGLLQLKMASPDNVFPVRGNHEDYAMNGPASGGTFLRELSSKFPDAAEEEMRQLFRVYETLPAAIFVGVLDDNVGRVGGVGGVGGNGSGNAGRAPAEPAQPQGRGFLLACHGGLEVGVDPRPLLRAPVRRAELLPSGAASHFALLHGVMRRGWLESLPTQLRDKVRRSVREELFSDIGRCALSDAGTGDESSGAGAARADWPLAPTELSPALGFMWNDFLVSSELNVTAATRRQAPLHFRPGRGFGFGHELTEYVLRSSGIVGVLRAHQHNDSPETGPMLSRICDASPPGAFDNFGRSGLVVTFLSGALIPTMGFSFDAFGLLRLRGAAPTWSIDMCVNPVTAPAPGGRCSSGSSSDPAPAFPCADMGWRASAAAQEPPPAAWASPWGECGGHKGAGSGDNGGGSGAEL